MPTASNIKIIYPNAFRSNASGARQVPQSPRTVYAFGLPYDCLELAYRYRTVELEIDASKAVTHANAGVAGIWPTALI